MSEHRLWIEGGTTFPDRKSRVLAACLAIGWVLLIAARNVQPVSSPPSGCGSDPWDFLPVGETIELKSLAFIVESHCVNAKYTPDGWIELRYGGAQVDVKLRRVDIGGATYFRIVSIGGLKAP